MDYIDPVTASLAHYKLLLETDPGRMLEMTVKAGAKDAVHSHSSELVYFIGGGTVRIHLPDGQSQEIEIADGYGMAHHASTHQVENIG